MKVAHSSITSTDTLPRRTPGASGHKPATLGPRPAFPVQAAPVRHLSHDLPSIPTARAAAGSYTRAQLDAAIAKAADDEPRIPAPHKPYDDIVLRYGETFAHSAF